MHLTDQDIWNAFRKGDKVAFEQLLQRFYRPMYDYGIRFQPDPQQLRDDLHDLMISLWDRRERLQETSHLKFYLFKALRHQIFRGKQKKEPLADWDSFEGEAVSGNDGPLLVFEEEEACRLQSRQIQQVLCRLSKRQQEVLHLKFYENLSNEQIADLLHITRPAAANLLYTALKAFKVLWKAEYYHLFILLFF